MTRSSTRRALAVAVTLGAAIGLATCADGITGPGGAQRATFSFAPQFASSAHSAVLALADAGLPLDRVRIVLVRPVHDTLKDTTITMHEGDPAVSLELTVVAQPNETLDAGLQFKSGETVLFEGHASVVTTAKVGSGGKPADITVVYVGPGAAATKVVVTPTQGSYSTDGTIQFHADAQDATGASLANTPFTWSLSDASMGTISSSGLLTPSGKRGSVTVTATTPVPLIGNATATFFLPAASITIVSGSGQTGTISTSLAQPLVAQVSAADGLGVPGVSVVFSSSAVGASFSPVTATTDANGRVATTVHLGSQAGVQDFAATAGTFVVHAAATATGGAPAAMFAVGPAAFTITSGVVPTTASAAKIVDAGGGAVANASAQVVITQGTSSTTTAATSDANGLITVPPSFALTAKAGDYTLTISSDGLSGSPVTFSMSVIPGAPAKLALKTAPSSSVQNGVAFPVQPIIQLLDVNGNEVATQSVVVTASVDVPILGGATTATTSANGSAAFTNLSISGVAGARVLTFSAAGLTSVTGTTTMTGAGVPGVPVRMVAIAGVGQKDTVGTVLAVSPAVQVLDGNGNGVPGVSVMFAVTGGQGSIPVPLVVTDSHGVASTPWALGTAPGLNVLTATAMDTTGAGVGFTGFTVGGGTLHVATFAGNPVTFNATALTGHATTMTKLGVDEIVSPTAGSPLFPMVRITDAYGNPVDNITVTFTVLSGAGLQQGSLFDGVNTSNFMTTTTSGGLAEVFEWILGTAPGTNQLSVSASGVGSASVIPNPVTFTVTTPLAAPPPMSPATAPVVTSISSPKEPPTLTP